MDPEERPTLRAVVTQIVGGLLGASLLYLLSVAPAAFIYESFPRSADAIRFLYAPLAWAAEDTTIFPWVEKYADWGASFAKPAIRKP